MPQLKSDQTLSSQATNPWLLWVLFFAVLLLFISLWTVSLPLWHLLLSLITISALWFGSPSPLKTLLFIVGLVLFLAGLQMIFSPYMRNLLMTSLEQGFHWNDWQYLLFAVERLAWPLMIVTIFESKMSNPAIAAQLTKLLTPFAWLGLKIHKLQVMLILALRFLPSLRKEWERFSHFQTYFTGPHQRKSLLQKLNYVQGILKAMISHTIHRASNTGDVLALRGLPDSRLRLKSQNLLGPLLIWLPTGLTLAWLDPRLLILWGLMSLWIALTAFAVTQENRP